MKKYGKNIALGILGVIFLAGVIYQVSGLRVLKEVAYIVIGLGGVVLIAVGLCYDFND